MDYSYVRVVTGPAAEPVYLDAAKDHLRVTGTDDDTLIGNLIRAARQFCEAYQGRSFVAKTYEMAFDDGFPEIIYPPFGPLISVSSVKYVDTAAAVQTVSTSVYTIDSYAEPPRVFEAYNQVWPSGVRGVENAVKVTYSAGYAAKFTAVAETDILTVFDRTYTDGDIVRLSNSGGALPAGLAANTDYYVRDVSGQTLKLAATADGAAIDITDAGSGINFLGEIPQKVIAAIKLVLGHLYEHREDVAEVEGRAGLNSIPMGAKMLLQQERANW